MIRRATRRRADVPLPIKIRRLFLGPPLPSSKDRVTRLGKPAGLAVLSGDALSSVAYATEAMVRVLLPVAGIAAFTYVLPISGVITLLLITLVFSYRQTIKAYPSAGGAYIVTKDNLGVLTAQVAGVGLALDYVMTVAVSVAAGVAAIYSAFPSFFPFRVVAAVALIWLIAWVNLRGLKTTGRVFATPTYLFITSILVLIVLGIARLSLGGLHPLPPVPHIAHATGAVGMLLILHAYASGTTALTGVEAISNGVPIFRPVEWRNARAVLTWMGSTLAVLFLGTAFLASRLHPVPTEKQTLLSELARAVFGSGHIGSAGYLFVQITTTAILIFAAQTSFSDFPRLSSFMARDGYLPAPFYQRGQRLAFSTGIVVLASFATIITIVLGANVNSLIPLFAVGAFSAFTFSQAGMTARHLRLRERGWRHSLAINGLGAVLSGAALVVILVAKFSEGAWVALIVVPLGVLLVTSVHRHYVRVQRRLIRARASTTRESALDVVILVSTLDEALDRTVRFVEGLRKVVGVEAVCLGRPNRALAAAFQVRYGRDLHFERRGRGASGIRRIARRLRRGHADRVALIVAPENLERSGPRYAGGATRLRRAISRERGVALAVVPTVPEDDSLLATRLDRHEVIVPVESADIVSDRAVMIGRLAAKSAAAVHFDVDHDRTQALVQSWATAEPRVQLQVEPAPFRDPTEPLLSLVRHTRQRGAFVTIVFGQLIPRWWQRPLHVDEFKQARSALLREPATALIVAPYHL